MLIIIQNIKLKQASGLPCLFLLCLSCLFSASLSAAPKLPPPPKATVELVGTNVVNGMSSHIRTFHTKEPIEKVVEFYRKKWKRPVGKGKPGYTESIAAAPWYIIARAEDDYLLTVQVQATEVSGDGSWGYLSIGNLSSLGDPEDDNVEELGKGIPKINGSTVVNEQKHIDPGKKAKTLLMMNDQSLAQNVAFYRNHFEGLGWTSEADQAMGETGNMHRLIFNNKSNRFTILLSEENGSTQIVVNSVTHTGL